MSHLTAIDPGPVQSAVVRMRDGQPAQFGIYPNADVRNYLRILPPLEHIAIEMIASMGMAVGQSVFETCVHIGRYVEIVGDRRVSFIKRHEVKTHICQNSRAKDANIRQALIDRFGGESAIGNKASPGPLYGIKADCWAALAVAVVWLDRQNIPQRA